jgi:hypothetical protein
MDSRDLLLEDYEFTGDERPLLQTLKEFILDNAGTQSVVSETLLFKNTGGRRGFVEVKYYPSINTRTTYHALRSKKSLVITHVLVSKTPATSETVIKICEQLLVDPQMKPLLEGIAMESVINDRFAENLALHHWEDHRESGTFIKVRKPRTKTPRKVAVSPIRVLKKSRKKSQK